MNSSKISPTPTDTDDVLLSDRLEDLDRWEKSLSMQFEDLESLGHGLQRSGELRIIRDRLRPAVERSLHPARQALADTKRIPANDVHGRWLQAQRAETRLLRISEELTNVAQGGLARAAGLDNGWCLVAENLLDEIGSLTVPWERAVVPGPSTRSKAGTWVVQLDTTRGLWTLPIVVHELGHYVVLGLENAYHEHSVPELLRTGPRYAEELFADMFAAYCLGPAYVATLVWNAIPVDAWSPPPPMSHPAWGLRVTCSDHIAKAEYPEMAWMAELVADYWQGQLEAVGAPVDAPEDGAAAYTAFTEKTQQVLAETASAARLDASGVLGLERRLIAGDPPKQPFSLRAVMSAAWAARLRHPGDRLTIERAGTRWIFGEEGDMDGHRLA